MNKHLYILIVLFNLQSYAQEGPNLDINFKGGARNFYQLMGQNLRYEDRTGIGLSILSWQVNKGQIQNIDIINPIGKSTEKELKRVLQLTTGYWNSSETVDEYYLPIKFKHQYDFSFDPLPKYYLDEIVLTGFGSNASAGKTDKALIKKVNSSIEKGKYKSAILSLDQAILRNPLNAQLRETRIYCYQELGLKELACEEILFLKTFLSTASYYSCNRTDGNH